MVLMSQSLAYDGGSEMSMRATEAKVLRENEAEKLQLVSRAAGSEAGVKVLRESAAKEEQHGKEKLDLAFRAAGAEARAAGAKAEVKFLRQIAAKTLHEKEKTLGDQSEAAIAGLPTPLTGYNSNKPLGKLQMFKTIVPFGGEPGQEFEVPLPNGQPFLLTCLPYVRAGKKFEFEVPIALLTQSE